MYGEITSPSKDWIGSNWLKWDWIGRNLIVKETIRKDWIEKQIRKGVDWKGLDRKQWD